MSLYLCHTALPGNGLPLTASYSWPLKIFYSGLSLTHIQTHTQTLKHTGIILLQPAAIFVQPVSAESKGRLHESILAACLTAPLHCTEMYMK